MCIFLPSSIMWNISGWFNFIYIRNIVRNIWCVSYIVWYSNRSSWICRDCFWCCCTITSWTWITTGNGNGYICICPCTWWVAYTSIWACSINIESKTSYSTTTSCVTSFRSKILSLCGNICICFWISSRCWITTICCIYTIIISWCTWSCIIFCNTKACIIYIWPHLWWMRWWSNSWCIWDYRIKI